MKTIGSIFILMFLSFSILGQGIHYTHFYTNPLLLNPALSGYTNNCLRIGTNTRQQWPGASKNENLIRKHYKTYSLFSDLKWPPNDKNPKWPLNQDWLGFGVAAFSDKAGDGNLTTNEVMVTTAYHTSFERFVVSTGFGLGYYGKSVNYDKLYFNSQWSGYEFDSNLENMEGNIGVTRSDLIREMSLGVLLSIPLVDKKDRDNRKLIFVGASWFHLFTQKETFYEFDNYLGDRTIYHVGYFHRFKKSDLETQLMFAKQRESKEIIYGFNYLWQRKFISGIWIHQQGEVAFNLGYNFISSEKDLNKRGLYFDRLLLSGNRNYVLNYNSFDISLLFLSNYKDCTCALKNRWPVISGRTARYGRQKRIKPRFSPPGECFGDMTDYWEQGKPTFIPDIYISSKFLVYTGDINPSDQSDNCDSDSISNPIGIEAVFGTGINNLYIGAGFGIEKWRSHSLIPLFLDIKYLFLEQTSNTRVTARYFLYTDIGYSLYPERKNMDDYIHRGGKYLNVGFGYDRPLKGVKKAIIASIGYRTQKIKTENLIETQNYCNESDVHYLELKIGARF